MKETRNVSPKKGKKTNENLQESSLMAINEK